MKNKRILLLALGCICIALGVFSAINYTLPATKFENPVEKDLFAQPGTYDECSVFTGKPGADFVQRKAIVKEGKVSKIEQNELTLQKPGKVFEPLKEENLSQNEDGFHFMIERYQLLPTDSTPDSDFVYQYELILGKLKESPYVNNLEISTEEVVNNSKKTVKSASSCPKVPGA